MKNHAEIRSLDQLMDGAIDERFKKELSKVLQNVFDLRTSPTKARSVQLTIKLVPNKARDAANMTFDIQTKLAPPDTVQQTVLMHQFDDGTVQMTERTDQLAGQMDFDGNESPVPKVVRFNPPEVKTK